MPTEPAPVVDLPDIYTIDEIMARYPHLSRDTMYDLLASGELHGFKIGRAWHVTAADFADFIAARRAAHHDDDGAADAPAAPSRRRSPIKAAAPVPKP